MGWMIACLSIFKECRSLKAIKIDLKNFDIRLIIVHFALNSSNRLSFEKKMTLRGSNFQ
jgi:hypothetical protein